MKTFGVSPVPDTIKLIIRTDDKIETVTFITKRKADKKILELLRTGYTFDRTHETLALEAAGREG